MAEGPRSAGTISRRRVLTGIAWATPAIVVAVATPPAAASEPEQQIPGGVLSIVGSGRRASEGDAGHLLRIDNTNLVFTGEGTVRELVVAVEFPKEYIFQPPTISPSSPSGWLDPIEIVDAGSVYRMVYTKDPNINQGSYIPNFGGGTWIRVVPGIPAFTATVVVMSGLTAQGGLVTGGGSITYV